MKNIIQYMKPATLCAVLLMLLMASCAKDEYYIDGGKADPKFNGTIMQYLESDPRFDTIAQIVKLADMEEVLSNENVTFFVPTDEVIRRTIGEVNSPIIELRNRLNQELFDQGRDTIKVLADVDPEIWKKYLSRYIFKGTYLLRDYPQLDFALKALYPGSFYYTYNNDLANIGVVYNSVNNVRYTGYRQLSISFIPDPSNPADYIAAAVATSDVQPTNGAVHVLALSLGGSKIGETESHIGANNFGFGTEFNRDVILSK